MCFTSAQKGSGKVKGLLAVTQLDFIPDKRHSTMDKLKIEEEKLTMKD
jgi:hypothetical protein